MVKRRLRFGDESVRITISVTAKDAATAQKVAEPIARALAPFAGKGGQGETTAAAQEEKIDFTKITEKQFKSDVRLRTKAIGWLIVQFCDGEEDKLYHRAILGVLPELRKAISSVRKNAAWRSMKIENSVLRLVRWCGYPPECDRKVIVESIRSFGGSNENIEINIARIEYEHFGKESVGNQQ